MTLPLPLEELPESTRRFVNPAAPVAARAMAAKGLVPVKGAELVVVLAQLTADADEAVAATARASLLGLPDAVLLPTLALDMPGPILDRVAEIFSTDERKLEILVQNPATPDATLAHIARMGSEGLTEIIAVNQHRLLQAPTIIESLYKNKHTRMSTADRLVELAARNHVELPNLPMLREHAEALEGMLIPEPTDEPLPSDLDFAQALIEDDDDPHAVEINGEEGSETVKDKFKPLRMRIGNMTKAEKIRMCVVGNAAARAILVRDNSKAIATAAVNSPSLTEMEAIAMSQSKEVSDEVLRIIANKRELTRSYEIKRALCFNPKTPVGISLKFLAHLRDNDVKELSRSRNVATPIKTAAVQRLAKKSG